MSYVVDIGSYETRQGIIGNQEPDMIFRSLLLSQKYDSSILNQQFKSRQIYDKTQQIPLYSIENSVSSNGKELYQGALFDLLKYSLNDNVPQELLIMIPPTIAPIEKKLLISRIFDEIQPEKLQVLQNPSTALFSVGRVDGLVLDSGESSTRIQCILDGFSTDFQVQKGGGRWLTQDLLDSIRRNGQLSLVYGDESRETNEEAELFYTDSIKKQIDFQHKQQLTLPDGLKIDIDFNETQNIINKTALRACELINKVLDNQSNIVKPKLLNNIIIAGGNSMINTFTESILKELQKQNKVVIINPPNKNLAQWVGASAVSVLTTFKQQFMTKEQWQEKGFM